MSISDFLTTYLFRKTASGKTLFRPWGYLGPEYVVEDDSRKRRIQMIYSYWVVISSVIVIVIALYDVELFYYFFFLPIIFLINALLGRYFTRGMPILEEKAPISERMTPITQFYSRRMLTFCLIGSVLGILLGVYILQMGGFILNGLFLLSISLLLTLYFYLVLRAKTQLAQWEDDNSS